MYKIEPDGSQSPEQFAEEAKFCTESRLLQRDVQIVLESMSNQNCIGSVLHPVCSPSALLKLKCCTMARVGSSILKKYLSTSAFNRTIAKVKLFFICKDGSKMYT